MLDLNLVYVSPSVLILSSAIDLLLDDVDDWFRNELGAAVGIPKLELAVNASTDAVKLGGGVAADTGVDVVMTDGDIEEMFIVLDGTNDWFSVLAFDGFVVLVNCSLGE